LELGSSFILLDTIVNGAFDVRSLKARHITLKSFEIGTIITLKFDDITVTDEFHILLNYHVIHVMQIYLIYFISNDVHLFLFYVKRK